MKKLFASRRIKRGLVALALALALAPFQIACSGSSEPFVIDPEEVIPLTVDTTALQAGTVGTVYSFQLSARGGGNQPGVPYQWQQVAVGGNGIGMPLGLSVSPDGRISGIPREGWTAAKGRFKFRVTSKDGSTAETPEMDFAIMGEQWASSPGISVGATGAPFRREGHSAVFVDTIDSVEAGFMLVWGGYGVEYNRVNPSDMTQKDYLADGGVYNLNADFWSQPDNLRAAAPEDIPNSLPEIVTGAPSARKNHTAVYTGRHMIVWGGEDASGALRSGGIYDAQAADWAPINTTGAPNAVTSHTAVWRSNGAGQMYVFGGSDGQGNANNELWSYDAMSQAWTQLTPSGNAPEARWGHVMAYDSVTDNIVIWGGTDGTDIFRNGYVYDPQANAWTQPPSLTDLDPSSPTGRTDAAAAVFEGRMIIWGGRDANGSLNDGSAFRFADNMWDSGKINELANGAQRPTVRYNLTGVPSRVGIIFWGGIGIQAPTNMNEEWGEGRFYVPSLN